MRSEDEIKIYLARAERNAIYAMSRNKWERFGYWASQAVHLRRILGISNTSSPFRPFSDLAKQLLGQR